MIARGKEEREVVIGRDLDKERVLAQCHDEGPAGREKVRVLLEQLLTNKSFVDEAVGPAAPLGTRKLYEDKDLGFQTSDVTRADLIIIGHGHADHMSDTAQVGAQTGAPIVGAPITIAKLLTQPVNPKQLISLRLPADVIQRWRATGPGWQTRIAHRLSKIR